MSFYCYLFVAIRRRTMSNTTSTDMSRTSSRTMSSFRCVSEQEPPGSVASTQITDKTIMPAADTHFFISDITSDRFVDELNIEDSPLELRTKTQSVKYIENFFIFEYLQFNMFFFLETNGVHLDC